MIKWNKKIFTKSTGTRRIVITLKPSGFMAWVRFFMFRQDYHNMLRTVQITTDKGDIIPMAARKDKMFFTQYEVRGFFEVRKNSEYSLEFELIDQANEWILNYKMSMISN